ncbi:DUF3558 domain-containing protein [Saccharopolyspora gregorii]|uniref:DUF3558 domain-containing protein n=1 Tax=Saccharopolyspora gregorii TaxID=33914 RepID=UPI0021AC2A46|nr:DUF3558 domain-containing protein [Saccharopolyspora gregorii]
MNSPVMRSLVVTAASVVLVSGCAVGGDSPNEGGDPSSSTGKPSGIADPRDASGIPPCELMKASDAQELGFGPNGKVTPNDLDPTMPDGCTWRSAEGATSVSLSVIPNRTIQQYRDASASFVDYAELNIAGHPAVRANDDLPENGSCGIYLAAKDDQILFSFAFDAPSGGEPFDPCSYAQGALERSVSVLPSVK